MANLNSYKNVQPKHEYLLHISFLSVLYFFESGFHYVTLHKIGCEFHFILTLPQTNFLTDAIYTVIELKNYTIIVLELLYSTI